MNHEEYLEFHKYICNKAFAVTKDKNHDYTPELDDALGNFRGYKLIGITEEQGILARIIDKVCRIGALLRRPGKVKESIIETASDMLNYIILFLACVYEREGIDWRGAAEPVPNIIPDCPSCQSNAFATINPRYVEGVYKCRECRIDYDVYGPLSVGAAADDRLHNTGEGG